MANRYFKPDKKAWKYTNENNAITEEEKSESIQKHFKFFNWTLSFTKNAVQVSFILFVIANIFIMAIATYSFLTTGALVGFETYINRVFDMFINVIGGYIIKSTMENTMKIGFSVLSDWLDYKYAKPQEEIVGASEPVMTEAPVVETTPESTDSVG